MKSSARSTGVSALVVTIIAIGTGCRDQKMTTAPLVHAAGRAQADLTVADDSIPARSLEPANATVHLPDDSLWAHIVTAGRHAMVGLKAPGKHRGVYMKRVLVAGAERLSAREGLIHEPGVTLVRESQTLPIVEVVLDNVATLSRLRALPFVDYVDPVVYMRPMDESSCGGMNAYSTAASDVAIGPLGDVIPWPYWQGYSDIQRAWARSQGDNILVGILDTGIDPGQPEFWSSNFNGYPDPSVQRTFGFAGSGDPCGHGTRVAGVIGAPNNGQNMVGIAWKSDLYVHQAGSSLDDGSDAVYWGLENVISRGARVIEMALKTNDDFTPCREIREPDGSLDGYDCSGVPTAGYYPHISDLIRYYYYQSNGPLFIGAAGTLPIGIENVFFPAELPEVIAVNGMNRDGSRQSTSNYGSKIEFAGWVDAASPGAPSKGSAGVVALGGSSGGSAMVAGIAALTWAAHPGWTNVQVRNQLRAAAQHPDLRNSGNGYGAINAYSAVGGFFALYMEGPTCVVPQYTPSIDLIADPEGEGPFRYQWDNGAQTRGISVPPPPAGTEITYSVSVTDLVENKTMGTSLTVQSMPEDYPNKTCGGEM